jgi:tetratricopeptide (TPR) repeat protein
MKARTTSDRLNILLGVALLALVLRLVYIWQISHAPFFDLRIGDARAYHEWAIRIASGDWLGKGVFYQAPFYPYFLAVVYKSFGASAAMVRFVQAVLGAGTCVLLAAAGMALFGESGAIAGLLLAVYPPAIFLDGLLEKSALVSFLTAALLYLVATGHSGRRVFFGGVILGCLCLTRENALLLAAPLLLWLLVHERRPLMAAIFIAGCLLVLLPVGVRNYTVGGEFHLTTSQFGPNFYIGNHAGASGFYEPLVSGHGAAVDEQDDAVRLAEEVSGRTLSPDEVSAFWTARALEFIREQPGAWLELLTRKLALAYNAVEIADTESQDVYAEWSSILRVLSPISFAVVFGLGALGAFMTADHWRRLWFLYAIALTYTASIVLFYVFARYRFPLVPMLILLGAGGIAAWRETMAPPKQRRRALAALVIAAGLAFLPLAHRRIDRTTHYVNIANAFLRDPAKWDQAADFYDKALKESPRSPAAHSGLGYLLVQIQRPEDAIAHYRTAVEGWPDNADLRLNFAVALAEAHDEPRALDELDAAAALRPRDPRPYLAAGRLLLTLSRPDEARNAFQQAVAADPRSADAHDGLGKALEAAGRLAEANEAFARARALNADAGRDGLTR